MKMLILLLGCFGLGILVDPVWAVDHYIRPIGSGGTGAGTSWTNAYLGCPSATTYVRGENYFIAGGTYSQACTFSTTVQSTTTIRICKATISTVGSCGSAHGQANFSTSNFVNYATMDFRLANATTAGTTLASPYNTDGFQSVTRGTDGTWDRGAYEFCLNGCGAGTPHIRSHGGLGFSGSVMTR